MYPLKKVDIPQIIDLETFRTLVTTQIYNLWCGQWYL